MMERNNNEMEPENTENTDIGSPAAENPSAGDDGQGSGGCDAEEAREVDLPPENGCAAAGGGSGRLCGRTGCAAVCRVWKRCK